MKRESDILKINFDRILKPNLENYLIEHPSITIEENCLKKYLDIAGFSAENIYQKLKFILFGTAIGVSIIKVDNGNAFTFYSEIAKKREKDHDIEERRLIKEHNIRIEDEYREFQKERKKVLDEELREEKRNLEIEVRNIEPLKPIPPPPSSLNFYNSENIDGTDEVDSDILFNCPVCGFNILFNDTKCKKCNTQLDWVEDR